MNLYIASYYDNHGIYEIDDKYNISFHPTTQMPSYIIRNNDLLFIANKKSDTGGGITIYDLKNNLELCIFNDGISYTHIDYIEELKLVLAVSYQSSVVSILKFENHSLNKLATTRIIGHHNDPHNRQACSHPHYISHQITKDNILNFYVCDLGSDAIYVLNLNNNKIEINNGSSLFFNDIIGPRHLAKASNNNYYLVNEIQNSLYLLGIDNHHLSIINKLQIDIDSSLMPTIDCSLAAIKCLNYNNYDYLFISARLHNSISYIQLVKVDGCNLIPLQKLYVDAHPRDIEIVDNKLVVASMLNHTIKFYELQFKHEITISQKPIKNLNIQMPVCICK